MNLCPLHIGRQILNQWPTREVPSFYLLICSLNSGLWLVAEGCEPEDLTFYCLLSQLGDVGPFFLLLLLFLNLILLIDLLQTFLSASLHSLQDLSSLTRDRTPVHSRPTERAGSQADQPCGCFSLGRRQLPKVCLSVPLVLGCQLCS